MVINFNSPPLSFGIKGNSFKEIAYIMAHLFNEVSFNETDMFKEVAYMEADIFKEELITRRINFGKISLSK